MGYSPCKNVSSGQKLKMAKRWEKRLYESVRLVVSKKALKKTSNAGQMRGFKKNKFGQNASGIAHAKWSVWVKNEKCQRGAKRDPTTILVLLLAKKRSKKQLILEKCQDFKYGQNWPPCRGYSPCKVVSLSQKWKMPKRWEKRSYDHIRVVVSKKALQKRPDTRKMRGF